MNSSSPSFSAGKNSTFSHALDLGSKGLHPDFDNLIALTATLFQTPLVTLSLVDEQGEWRIFSSVTQEQHSSPSALCQHVQKGGELLVVSDLQQSQLNAELMTDMPLNNAQSFIGHPLTLPGGHVVGALSLFDNKVRVFDAAMIDQLGLLARHINHLLDQSQIMQGLEANSRQSQQDLKHFASALAHHNALLRTAAAGIVSINDKGIIQSVNAKLLSLFGYEEAELIGSNIKMLMPEQLAKEHDDYLKNYKDGVSQNRYGGGSVIGEGRELLAKDKTGQPIAIHLAVSQVINPENDQVEFIGIITDIREQKRVERKVWSERALLSTLHEGITNFNALISGNQLWEFLQQSLVEITESEYAFIGEVIYPDNKPSLKIHSITDLSWNDESRRMAGELLSGDRVIDNPNSLLGRVFAKGETVIVADMQTAQGKGGQPEGHPELHNYLGIPIIDDSRVIGMFAIANSELAIDEALANWLEPFTSTCALLIRFYRMISEKERVMAELRYARDEMEAASKAKSDFLSSMSHELRTPLNSIIGFSQLMLTQTKNPLAEKQLKQAEQIHKSGKHLLTLINEILDLAKIESGKLSLSIEPSNLYALIEDSLQTVQPIADDACISLNLNVDKNVAVMADYTRLKQVIINLLSNAIKYNREQGSVNVRVTLHEVFADIAVIDTGHGVDMEMLDELFEPFNRLGAENSGIEGTGVGLALTKKLVEYMNGEISVRSDRNGSTFTVRLPLAEESIALVSMEGVPKQNDKGQEEYRDHFLVMYVEDNPTNQSLMEDIFEDLEGFALHCEVDPLIGFEKAKRLQPDLLILDINLPNIDGFELLSMIKTIPGLCQTPVIALSANAMSADVQRGLESGFEHYLTKPLDIPILLSMLQDYQMRFKEVRD